MNEVTVVHIPDKATVMSAYKLSDLEMNTLKKMHPELESAVLMNVVDVNIISGVVIKYGTKIIDLTLNGALENLKKQIYESN